VNARHPEVIWLDWPARFTYLHLLSDCIADMLKLIEDVADAEMLLYNIQLAAHEACTNIVNHAYGNSGEGRISIKLTLDFTPSRLTIELQDEGRPFDPSEYSSPNLDEVRIHGYGLFLIENLMDSVVYTPLAGRNHWSLTKNLFAERM
jgi:serine/threonine-protein kinase RsbW